MAKKSSSSSGIGNAAMYLVIGLVIWYIWQHNPGIVKQITDFFSKIGDSLGSSTTTPTTTPTTPTTTDDSGTTPSTTGTSGTPTTTTGGGAAGDCAKSMYPTTGKTQQAQASGFKTRHYASGKPDDITQEWNAESCPFENYAMIIYVNIGAPDHNDTVSLKMWGPHHTDGQGAWYIVDFGFDGKTGIGHEKPHPTTSSYEKVGTSTGSIVNKDVGLAAVIWKLPGGGGHVEGWWDVGGKWTKLVEGDNVGGTFTKDASQQVQFRIDAAPKVVVKCATVVEITPGGTGGASTTTTPAPAATTTPTAAASLAQFINPGYRTEHECGLLCETILKDDQDYLGYLSRAKAINKFAFLPSNIKVKPKL